MRQRPAIRIKSVLYLLQKRKCATTKGCEQTPKMSWAQPALCEYKYIHDRQRAVFSRPIVTEVTAVISEYVLERRALCMNISTKTGGLPQKESRPPAVGLSTQDKQAD